MGFIRWLFVLAVLCFALPAHAADIYWINPAGGFFGDSKNWDPAKANPWT